MNQYIQGDIICALATPQGTGALHVVRISGVGCIALFSTLFSQPKITQSPGYSLHHGWIRTPEEGDIDEVMITLFRAPKSYTGEESLEITCHGSMLMVQRILRVLGQLGMRQAEAGEFTFRAFMNGKLNATQAEAVADLIHAESVSGQQAALMQLRGGFAGQLKILRQRLIELTALMELELDFSEEDVEFARRDEVCQVLEDLIQHMAALRDSFRYGRAVKEGIPTILAGKPNAGKSTLMNALLQEERAIVSATPGTTRDTIEERIQVNGIQLRLIDTAGLRTTGENIEQLGINKTREKLRQARLVLWVLDGGDPSLWPRLDKGIATWKEKEEIHPEAEVIWVINKQDLCQKEWISQWQEDQKISQVIAIEARNADTLSPLWDVLKSMVPSQSAWQDGVITSVKHDEALRRACEAAHSALEGLRQQLTTELVAVDLHEALHFTGLVTAEVTHDDLLDYIFSKFCIGK